jgi:hypothetical protein
MTDKYAMDKKALHMYARDVGAESPPWNSSAYRIKAAQIDREAFTNAGFRIADTYERLVDQFSWYAWRISVTLWNVEQALNDTADNYGKAEMKSSDDITKVGKQF